MMKNKMVSKSLYRKFVENFPIVCVDIVLVIEGKVLLIKRKRTPFKGWWFPGGRVLKGEKLERAVLRKLKEETNINGVILSVIGVYETKSPKAYFGGNRGTHTINICYLVTPKKGKQALDIDDNHSDFGFFSSVRKGWATYIKKVIIDSQILQNRKQLDMM